MIPTNAFATGSQALKFCFCAIEAVIRATAQCLEALSELNGEALQVAFDGHSAIVAQARTPAEITTLQIGASGTTLQKAMAYWQRVGTIMVETCSGTTMDIRHCFSEASPQGLELVDSLLGGALTESPGRLETRRIRASR
ncbi:phasin family protein [Paraburkholderia caribensis]|nr:phasin family protein [Paraburkholderia caribensis]